MVLAPDLCCPPYNISNIFQKNLIFLQNSLSAEFIVFTHDCDAQDRKPLDKQFIEEASANITNEIHLDHHNGDYNDKENSDERMTAGADKNDLMLMLMMVVVMLNQCYL